MVTVQASDSRAERGFTLIELLVVMIIIGILAAIAIPVFTSQRAKARDAAVKANIRTLGQEVSSYFVDHTTPPWINLRALPGLPGFRIAFAPWGTAQWEDAGMLSPNVWSTSAHSGSFPPAVSYVVDTTGWTPDAWCVQLFDSVGGTQVFKFSAQKGLQTGFCASSTAP